MWNTKLVLKAKVKMVEIARTYFFPAFALRQNRVENFQLLRSDTGRNASYVNSTRKFTTTVNLSVNLSLLYCSW